MTTDFRAMCAGYEPGDGSMDGAMLVDGEWWHPMFGCDSLQMVVDRARAALAEPEPEGPTDEELLELAEDWPCTTGERHDLSGCPEVSLFSVFEDELIEFARAVLVRWGRSDGPAVPNGREPASVSAEPSGPIPADGEVAELVAWLEDEADQYDCIAQAPDTSRKLRRAADLLERLSPP